MSEVVLFVSRGGRPLVLDRGRKADPSRHEDGADDDNLMMRDCQLQSETLSKLNLQANAGCDKLEST